MVSHNKPVQVLLNIFSPLSSLFFENFYFDFEVDGTPNSELGVIAIDSCGSGLWHGDFGW